MAHISHSYAMLLVPFLFLRGLMDGSEYEQVLFLLLPYGSITCNPSLMKVQPKGIKHFLMESLCSPRIVSQSRALCVCAQAAVPSGAVA